MKCKTTLLVVCALFLVNINALQAQDAMGLALKTWNTVGVPQDQQLVLGSSREDVMSNLGLKPKRLKRVEGWDGWSFNMDGAWGRTVKLPVDEKPLTARSRVFVHEIHGITEVDYDVSVTGWSEGNPKKVIRIYKWLATELGEPVENPEILINPSTLNASWICDDDVIVHFYWPEGGLRAYIRFVATYGPSRKEVENIVAAHIAQFTMEEFEKIRVGMTLDQVLETIGSIGVLVTEELVEGEIHRTHAWQNGDGSVAEIVSNDKNIVIKKHQRGLP